jgi:hypothetical protein
MLLLDLCQPAQAQQLVMTHHHVCAGALLLPLYAGGHQPGSAGTPGGSSRRLPIFERMESSAAAAAAAAVAGEVGTEGAGVGGAGVLGGVERDVFGGGARDQAARPKVQQEGAAVVLLGLGARPAVPDDTRAAADAIAVASSLLSGC